MKEMYEEPKITIISFENFDIITTSDDLRDKDENIGEWDF